MGIYLATGVAVEMVIPKKDRNGIVVTLEDVFEKLTRDVGFVMQYYDVTDDEQETRLSLKKDLLEQQLPDFLRAYYAIMYVSKEDSDDNGSKVVAAIESKTADEMLAIAAQKSFTMFQVYDHADYLYFHDKPFRPSLKIRYKSIVLSLEGKVIMESYGTHFSFFKKCMLAAFSEYSLISSVQVFLTE